MIFLSLLLLSNYYFLLLRNNIFLYTKKMFTTLRTKSNADAASTRPSPGDSTTRTWRKCTKSRTTTPVNMMIVIMLLPVMISYRYMSNPFIWESRKKPTQKSTKKLQKLHKVPYNHSCQYDDCDHVTSSNDKLQVHVKSVHLGIKKKTYTKKHKEVAEVT